MINKQKIQDLLQEYLSGNPASGLFAVSVSVSPRNEIKVYIDGMKGVGIDTCVEVSRFIESRLDREAEDFELTVSSAGLDQPLRVPAQYRKNAGQEVKVTTRGGDTFKGEILEAGSEGFSIRETLRKPRSARKKENDAQEGENSREEGVRRFSYDEVKETKIVISFK